MSSPLTPALRRVAVPPHLRIPFETANEVTLLLFTKVGKVNRWFQRRSRILLISDAVACLSTEKGEASWHAPIQEICALFVCPASLCFGIQLKDSKAAAAAPAPHTPGGPQSSRFSCRPVDIAFYVPQQEVLQEVEAILSVVARCRTGECPPVHYCDDIMSMVRPLILRPDGNRVKPKKYFLSDRASRVVWVSPPAPLAVAQQQAKYGTPPSSMRNLVASPFDPAHASSSYPFSPPFLDQKASSAFYTEGEESEEVAGHVLPQRSPPPPPFEPRRVCRRRLPERESPSACLRRGMKQAATPPPPLQPPHNTVALPHVSSYSHLAPEDPASAATGLPLRASHSARLMNEPPSPHPPQGRRDHPSGRSRHGGIRHTPEAALASAEFGNASISSRSTTTYLLPQASISSTHSLPHPPAPSQRRHRRRPQAINTSLDVNDETPSAPFLHAVERSPQQKPRSHTTTTTSPRLPTRENGEVAKGGGGAHHPSSQHYSRDSSSIYDSNYKTAASVGPLVLGEDHMVTESTESSYDHGVESSSAYTSGQETVPYRQQEI